jgi:hypothetical protein
MSVSASSKSLITDFSLNALRAVADDYDVFWTSDAWDFSRVPDDGHKRITPPIFRDFIDSEDSPHHRLAI